MGTNLQCHTIFFGVLRCSFLVTQICLFLSHVAFIEATELIDQTVTPNSTNGATKNRSFGYDESTTVTNPEREQSVTAETVSFGSTTKYPPTAALLSSSVSQPSKETTPILPQLQGATSVTRLDTTAQTANSSTQDAVQYEGIQIHDKLQVFKNNSAIEGIPLFGHTLQHVIHTKFKNSTENDNATGQIEGFQSNLDNVTEYDSALTVGHQKTTEASINPSEKTIYTSDSGDVFETGRNSTTMTMPPLEIKPDNEDSENPKKHTFNSVPFKSTTIFPLSPATPSTTTPSELSKFNDSMETPRQNSTTLVSNGQETVLDEEKSFQYFPSKDSHNSELNTTTPTILQNSSFPPFDQSPEEPSSDEPNQETSIHQFFLDLRSHTLLCVLSLLLLLLFASMFFSFILATYLIVKYLIILLIKSYKKCNKCRLRRKFSSAGELQNSGSLFPRCNINLRPYENRFMTDREREMY